MNKKPGYPVRGSKTGRPIMVLLDALGQRWTLRILWEMRQGRSVFRVLRSRCDDVSPTILNSRLKMLRSFNLVDLEDGGYGLTAKGNELVEQFAKLDQWADGWARTLSQ